MQNLKEHINSLNKRRIVTIYIVLLFAALALIYSFNFTVSSLTYFNGEYNLLLANGLIVYKFIELLILYYILFYRYIVKMKNLEESSLDYEKLKKHTKLLYFLIPQGNTIFGLIAFKLTADIFYFLFFSIIALFTLIIIKPNSLKYNLNSQP